MIHKQCLPAYSSGNAYGETWVRDTSATAKQWVFAGHAPLHNTHNVNPDDQTLHESVGMQRLDLTPLQRPHARLSDTARSADHSVRMISSFQDPEPWPLPDFVTDACCTVWLQSMASAWAVTHGQ